MMPTPSVIGLSICQVVIVDARSNNPSIISLFTGHAFDSFPTDRVPFSVFCTLTDAAGSGTIRLEVRRLTDDSSHFGGTELIYIQQGPIEFPDRLRILNVHFRLTKLRFPRPGSYLFTLRVDGEWVADRKLRVYAS
jgi:hypothetical protein